MLRISRNFVIDDDIEISFVRASAQGGQNVNTLSTTLQLRLWTIKIAALREDVAAPYRLASQVSV